MGLPSCHLFLNHLHQLRQAGKGGVYPNLPPVGRGKEDPLGVAAVLHNLPPFHLHRLPNSPVLNHPLVIKADTVAVAKPSCQKTQEDEEDPHPKEKQHHAPLAHADILPAQHPEEKEEGGDGPKNHQHHHADATVLQQAHPLRRVDSMTPCAPSKRTRFPASRASFKITEVSVTYFLSC